MDKVWKEGEDFSPSPPLSKEPSDEERAEATEAGANLIRLSHPVQIQADGQSGDPWLEERVIRTMREAFHLWQARQQKYGRANIARTGATGCYVRCEDKLSRLRGVYTRGKGEMPDESIADSWLDLINYGIMGLMCHRGQWPGQDSVDWYGETNTLKVK